MTNAEMLKQLIDLATSRGFVMDKHRHFCEIGRNVITGEIESLGAYESILFDQDFAKTIFGNKLQKVYGGVWNTYDTKPITIELHEIPVWQYHLQQLVVISVNDRIKYAWENKI